MSIKLTPEMIRAIRINLGYTQGQLARKAEISVPLLGAIERKERSLMANIERKIREAIKLSDDEVLAIMDVYAKVNRR